MKNQKGLTLIELMIVIAIVAIIASVAYPTFLEQIHKTRRADGHAHLLDVAARQERFYTEFGRYTTNIGSLNISAQSPEGFYLVTIGPPPGGDTQQFTLSAAPQGGQTSDKCGNLTYNQAGAKGQQNYTTDVCW